MKSLKESILNRNNHSGEGFKAQRRDMIENWLKEYNIKNYTINDDFTIDVNRSVDLSDNHLSELSEYIQFNIVKGYFDCSNNELTSLKGAPRIVERGFCCSHNELTSLKGAPEKVKWDFDCSNNELTSLKGAPKEVGGDFYCRKNTTKFTETDVRKVCNVKGSINC